MLSVVAAAMLQAASFDPAYAFGRLPYLTGVEVSPGGTRFAAIQTDGDMTGLLVYQFEGERRPLRFLREDDNLKIRDYFWKRDDRLVFSAAIPAVRYGTPTVETRLMAIDPDGDDIDQLFKRPRNGDMPVQIQDRIVSTLPRDPEHIMVQYVPANSEGTRLYRVHVDRRGRHNSASAGSDRSRHFAVDMQGNVRARWGRKNEQRLLHLMMPDGKWKNFSHRLEDGQPRFVVAGFPNVPTKAFVLSDHQTDTTALYLFNTETDQFEEQLFSHPTSDVYGIRQRLSDGAAYGAIFAEDDTAIHYFGENIVRSITDQVRKSLDADEISFRRMNPQETMAVFWAADEGRPGVYYIYNIADNQLTSLPPLYPELEGVALGKVVPTSYQARDGLTIPAFVTLPPGLESLEAARRLPFVVLPHGGPNARDFSGFDWMTQYFAHLGYGVLQMNFRGSTGYGAEFRDAGDRQWGQAMQDDITDGTNWLVRLGAADPERLVIAGASYGGYAALMGAVKTPDLFSCAISINGVSSLPEVINDQRDYIDGKYSTRHIGRLWRDREMLRENSPRNRADEITVPVLLVASEDDRVVPETQSTRMHRAIERAGGQSQLVELPEGSHYLDVGQNRITLLREVGSFLGQCRRP